MLTEPNETHETHEPQTSSLAKTFALYLLCFVGGLVLFGGVATHFVLRGDVRSFLQSHMESSLQGHAQALNISILNRIEVLRAYASLPVLTGDVAAPGDHGSRLASFVGSLRLFGRDPNVSVHDFQGKPLVVPEGACAERESDIAEILRPLLDGTAQHAIRLLPQRGDKTLMHWFLAVPVMHGASPEGALSVCMTTHLGSLVDAAEGHHLELLQNGVVVAELGNGKKGAAVASQDLAFPGLGLRIEDDGSGLHAISRSLLWKFVLSLLFSAVLVSVLLYPVGRRIILASHERLKELSDMLEEKNVALRREAAERIQTMDLLEYKSLLLEQQEQFLRDVIEDQTELICRFRTDGTVTFANSSYCEFVGQDKEALENQARFLVVGEGGFGGLDELMHSLTAEEPTAETTISLTDARGDFRWVHWTLRALLFGDGGGVKEFQAVGRDVTETRSLQLALERTNRELEKRVAERTSELMQKNTDLAMEINDRRQAEEAARSNERLLSTLLDGLHAAFVVIECETGKVVNANEVAGELLGVEIGQLQSDSCPAVLEPLFGASASVVCMGHESEPGYTEDRLMRSDGVAIPVDRFVLPVDDGHLAVILIDISQRKELERQLNTAQKMESIGLLASGIAHEINTPIQYTGDSVRFLKEAFDDVIAVLAAHGELIGRARADGAYAEILATIEELAEEADLEFVLDEFPKACDRALDGTTRVAKIVLAMKNFAHPGTEEKKAVDLNKALENTITVAKNEWKYYAEMRLDLSPDLPLVFCQPGDMNQVFLNIIVNAAHAIKDVVGESDTVGSIAISTALEEDMAVVRVADSGSGIAPENIDKIFDPFFTTKEVGKGTGQGLAIVHDIVVNKHGGSIDVKSEVGTGTTFSIILPVRPPEENETA